MSRQRGKIRGTGGGPGDRRDCQRISGKRRRKSMGSLVSPRTSVGCSIGTWVVLDELGRTFGGMHGGGDLALRRSLPQPRGDAIDGWGGDQGGAEDTDAAVLGVGPHGELPRRGAGQQAVEPAWVDKCREL